MCALVLIGGFVLKAQCFEGFQAGRGVEFERLCYNDLQNLYVPRALDQRVFPYIDGALVDGQLVNGAIEYPVLTGVFMWVASHFATTSAGYLTASAVLLAPFGLLTAALLEKMTARRAFLWAAAPALVLYSFHNWDLLVAAAAVGGFLAWSRKDYVLAAALLGVGGALKIFPLFFLAPLFLERWRAGDRRGALTTASVGAGVFTLINLPFALANFEGWWATYEFHQIRHPFLSDNSIWVWAFQSPPMTGEQMNFYSTVLIGASFVAALAVGWIRSRRDGVYPFVQVSAALVTAFVLWSKVHSPQYILWVLPFFILLNVPLVLWALYSLADVLLYVGTFRWFYDICAGHFSGTCTPVEDSFAKDVLLSGLWGRAAVLVVMFVVFLRARRALGAEVRTASNLEEPTLLGVDDRSGERDRGEQR